mmetsp:Transcript_19033/g.32139  ORF Transcript_19033/g.32139 Transcript_19033/m.32139 type:complete len:200 (+) Transcript_19033:500-1099(+)
MQEMWKAHRHVLGSEEFLHGNHAAVRGAWRQMHYLAELQRRQQLEGVQSKGQAVGGGHDSRTHAARLLLCHGLRVRLPDRGDGTLPVTAGGWHNGHVRRCRHSAPAAAEPWRHPQHPCLRALPAGGRRHSDPRRRGHQDPHQEHHRLRQDGEASLQWLVRSEPSVRWVAHRTFCCCCCWCWCYYIKSECADGSTAATAS